MLAKGWVVPQFVRYSRLRHYQRLREVVEKGSCIGSLRKAYPRIIRGVGFGLAVEITLDYS